MITVQRKKGQITVSGHAGYAEKGHDIVCAAVLILIYNLQNSIEYGTLSAKGRLLVNSLYSCHLHNVTAKCTCKDLF